jgi:histidinol dehydrogenase
MRILSGRAAEDRVRKLEQRGATDLARVEKQVRRIVDQVRRTGDRALRKYSEQWDGLDRKQPLLVSREQMEQAWSNASADFRRAIEFAATQIRRYCEWQKPREWSHTTLEGIQVGQVARSLHSAGCYVPGGRYPLPSTMLMTVPLISLPAQRRSSIWRRKASQTSSPAT